MPDPACPHALLAPARLFQFAALQAVWAAVMAHNNARSARSGSEVVANVDYDALFEAFGEQADEVAASPLPIPYDWDAAAHELNA